MFIERHKSEQQLIEAMNWRMVIKIAGGEKKFRVVNNNRIVAVGDNKACPRVNKTVPPSTAATQEDETNSENGDSVAPQDGTANRRGTPGDDTANSDIDETPPDGDTHTPETARPAASTKSKTRNGAAAQPGTTAAPGAAAGDDPMNNQRKSEQRPSRSTKRGGRR